MADLLPDSTPTLPLQADTDTMGVSVCICTRNRPTELERALQSIAESNVVPHQVLVSDDSDGDETERLVDSSSLPITYLRGPRSGLAANRNRAISGATGNYLLFLDDDGTIGKDFLREVATLATSLDNDLLATIFTGVDIENGHTVGPSAQGFLGFQSRPYRPGEPLRTVVINAALFPRSVFEIVQFDPSLVYGYDEVDVTTQEIAAGFRIVPCFSAVNYHFPSHVEREQRLRLATAARLYVTLKRRRWTEGSRLRGWLGFGAAVLHLYGSSVLRRGSTGFREATASVATARGYYATFVNSRRHSDGAGKEE